MLQLKQNITKLNLTLKQSGVVIKVQPVISITEGDISLGQDKHFVFNQSNPSNSWIINHSLNKFPSVSIVDTSGNLIYGEIKYNSINQITLSFSSPFSGKAYLN